MGMLGGMTVGASGPKSTAGSLHFAQLDDAKTLSIADGF